MIDFDALVLRPTVGIFGELVVYASVAGPAFTINGVFDLAYKPIDPLSLANAGLGSIMGAHVTTEHSALGVRLGDFPIQPRQGDAVTARGLLYFVREVQVDGKGGAKLVLSAAKD